MMETDNAATACAHEHIASQTDNAQKNDDAPEDPNVVRLYFKRDAENGQAQDHQEHTPASTTASETNNKHDDGGRGENEQGGDTNGEMKTLDADVVLPPVLKEHVDNCRFSSWYPKFANVSLPSTVISPLPEDFVEYLFADQIFLPDRDIVPESGKGVDDSDDSGDEGWDDDGEGEHEAAPNFPELEQQIFDAVTKYGNVFPKLNWSAPRDATWMSPTGTLKCDSPSSVFLLLKASDFIAHDLEHAYRHCADANGQTRPDNYELVLRKWTPVNPSMEFRCFVRHNKLVGVTQRDHNHHYEFLAERREEILGLIEDFYEEHLLNKFQNENYVFDVYITLRDRVKLVDFNPYCESTDPGLYAWAELANADGSDPELRIVTERQGVRHSNMSYARVPRDVIDITSGADPEKFTEIYENMQQMGVHGDKSN